MAGTATTRVTGLQSGPGGLMIFRLADLLKHQSSARHWAVIGGQTLTIVYREATPGAPPVPPHHHPSEQIILLLEGNNSMVINGVSGRTDPGQLSYVPPNVRHQGGESAPLFRRYFELFTPPHEQFVEQYQQGAIYSYPDSDPTTEDRAHQGPFFRTFSDSWIEKAPGVREFRMPAVHGTFGYVEREAGSPVGLPQVAPAELAILPVSGRVSLGVADESYDLGPGTGAIVPAGVKLTLDYVELPYTGYWLAGAPNVELQ